MMDKNETPKKESAQRGNEKPVSLAPLEFEEALDNLLQVKPEPKGKPKKERKKRKGS